MTSKLNLREQRRAARAKRRNQQRIITIVSILVIIAAIGAVLFYNLQSKKPEGELITTLTGLQYQDLTVGTGVEAKTGNTVTVHYVGTLEDGTKFDSSRDRNEPFELTLGAGGVIQGWEEGLIGMRVGGIRKLVIPPDLGYGSQAVGDVIPANATLVFEIELLSIK